MFDEDMVGHDNDANFDFANMGINPADYPQGAPSRNILTGCYAEDMPDWMNNAPVFDDYEPPSADGFNLADMGIDSEPVERDPSYFESFLDYKPMPTKSGYVGSEYIKKCRKGSKLINDELISVAIDPSIEIDKSLTYVACLAGKYYVVYPSATLSPAFEYESELFNIEVGENSYIELPIAIPVAEIQKNDQSGIQSEVVQIGNEYVTWSGDQILAFGNPNAWTLAIAPTGRGKTYLVCKLTRCKRVLAVPGRSLAKQISTQYDIPMLDGEVSISELDQSDIYVVTYDSLYRLASWIALCKSFRRLRY